MEKVSIVIPTYNQAPYFQACFDSCYFQTYSNIEIIVVDGGSTDETKTYLSALKERIASNSTEPVLYMDYNGSIIRKKCLTYHEDTHTQFPSREVKIISFKTNIGRTETYNAGFREASGAYCTYIVGDDYAHPHMIEALVGALEQTRADVAYSDFNIVNRDGSIVRLVRKPDYSFENCFAKWFHLGVSRLHRTIWHQKIGLMDEKFQVANDYEFYLRMAKAGAVFHHVGKVLYSVRFHGFETNMEESKRLVHEAQKILAERKSKNFISCHNTEKNI
jgi:glycosyltransferase involved in cell wall biosynthesis